MRRLKIAWYFLISLVIGILDRDAADFWYLARLRELEENYYGRRNE